MRRAAEEPDSKAAERIGSAAGEVAGELRPDAAASESGAAGADPAGGELPGSEREPAGLQESGEWQESLTVRAGAGTAGEERPADAVHHLRAVGAGTADRQAGTAAEPGDQTAGAV